MSHVLVVIATCCAASQSLRRELRTVDGELSAVGDASRLVIGDATADSQTDIRTAITSLGDRLKTLEGRAQQKEEGLQERNREWKLYQVTLGGETISGEQGGETISGEQGGETISGDTGRGNYIR